MESDFSKAVVTRDELREMQMDLARQRAARRGAGDEVARSAILRERMSAAGVPLAYRDVAADRDSLPRLEAGSGFWIAGTDNGTGKTTRAARMVRAWLERGHGTAAFVRCPGIRAVDRGASTEQGRWVSAGLLVLDDLGKEPRSEWVAARVLDVVDARASAGRPIVVTSNLSIAMYRDALVAGGIRNDTAAALYSRLNGICEALHVEGTDMREGKWERAESER